RTRPARLRPYDRLGRRLRRRRRLVPDAETRTRCAWTPPRARLLVGRRGHRPRFRLAGLRVVRAVAPGRVPLRRADERAVRRRAAAAESERDRARAQHPRRPRGARPAAQALPVVLLDARSERKHVALSAARDSVPAPLL